jgi:site-specific DNA-cytosine methylase
MATRKEIAQNQKILYDDAVANNMFQAAVPSFKEFQKRLEGQGYQKMVYDNYKKHNVRGKGFNNLNEFRGAFGGSFYADENKIGVSNRTAAILSSANNAVRQAKRNIQTKLGQAKKFNGGRVSPRLKNPLQNQNIQKNEFNYNSTTGKTGTYTTTDGVEFDNEYDASQYQNKLDKYGEEWNNAVDMGVVPSELDMADPDLSDTDVAMRQMERRQEWLNENQDRRSKELNESMHLQGSPFVASGGAVAPSSFNTAISNEANRLSDVEYGAYNTAKAYNQMLRTTLLQELKEQKQRNENAGWLKDKWNDVSNYFGAMFNTMLDPKLYSQGVMDAAIANNLLQVKKGMEDGTIKKGSNAGNAAQAMLGAIQQQQGEAAKQQQYGTKAYLYGDMSGRSLKFMGDFALSGWRNVMTTGFTKAGEKVGEKMALGALGKWFTKNTGRVLGDMAGSAALAATNQLGSTYNNVIERYVGMNNENGGVTQDKNGDLKFNEGVSLGKAIKDGFGSATIENFSEMFGEYLPGAPKLLSKLGLSKVSAFFEKIGNNAYYKWLSNATNKSGIQGVMAEISEEEFGTALHAAWGDGDGSWSDFNVFTNPDAREKQIDTCLGMFYSVGFMHAPRTAIGAINAVLYFNIKHQVAKADKFGQMMFNDKWEDIKSKIDVTTNADLTKTVLDATRSDSMTAKQKGAIINYAMFLSKLRGFNQASDAKTKDKVEEGETAPTLSNDLDDAYTEGHNADDADKHNIQLEQNDKANELAAMLHITPEQLHDMADEDLEAMTGQDDELDKAIYDYQVSTAKYQGVMDGAQDEVDMAAHQAAMETDNMTDLSRGTVRKATIKATGGLEDYEVYIISGNIATHDDGSIDVGNSDDMIIYYDPTTGRKEHADAMMFADLIEELPAAGVKAQAVADAKENAIKKIAGIVDGTIDVGSQFSVTDSDGTEHTYEVLADNGDGTAMITIDGNVPTELVNGENVQIPYSFADLQQLKDAEDLKRLKAAKTEREQMEKERAAQQTEQTLPSFDFKEILNDNGNVVEADVIGKDGNSKFPNSKIFLIRNTGAKAKVVELKSDGTLKSHAVNKEDVQTATSMSLEEYKQARFGSSMIEENSGSIEADRGGIEVEDNTQPLSEADADNVIAQMESSAEVAPELELTPDNWVVEFGEDGIVSTPIGDVKMGENQVAKLFEKGRSKEFGMIKPTLTDPDVIIEVPSHSADGNEERSSSYLFIKTFLGKNGEKVYYFKSVTIKKDGLEISISSHYDRAKRVKETLMKGKLLYRKNDGAQTEQNQPSASVTTSQEDAAGSSENKDTNISANSNENNESLTFEDGTPIPVDENGETDLRQTDAAHAAEWYDNNLGEDADDWLDGEIKKAKKALEQAKNKKLTGTKPSELVASKKEKEAAIADAQAHYDSAISIRDSLKERRIAKEENTADGRKNLIEKARRKFSRLKSAVKDDAEAVSQLYKDVVGSLLHRLYDGTGIDVTDTIPLTAEEYVASNLGAHSINYEGTETSKGVKQETGLSREDFAKTQLLAADGKGTTIDDLVHSLWENRPSNLESLDTQDIRNALIGLLNSGFKASEARNYIENLRIAQAENILEEQKKAADNAAFAEENKAESEQQTETAPESEEKTEVDSSDEINDEENEQTNAPEQNKFPEKLKEGSKTIEVPEDATDEKPLGEQRTKSPFLVRENGKQQTETESDADVEKNKVDDMKVVDNIVGEKTRKTLEKIAKIMGANIQWLYSNKQFNGRFDEKTNTIYLTLDSSITEGVQFIFGHEMTHEMRTKNPAAYGELKTLVKDMMGEDAFNSETDKIQIRYKKGGARYWNDRKAIEEEVVADQLGIWIRDANYAHTLLLKMSHPLLARLHEIVNSFLMALHGTEFSDDMRLILRSIEQAYVKTAKGEVTNSETGEDVSFSLRQKPEPKKKGLGYKVFVLKDGKLYPPMVANPDGAATPVGVWLDADAAPIAGESKTGRPQVKQGGKGTQGGSGKLAYRPGWHLGVVPYAIQFNRKDAEGNKTLFPKNFVFAEVEYAADVDYQEEARQEGINPSGKYQHSLAGLKHLPTDGYYMYRTNPNPETDPWVITGAMKVNRILTRAEQADLVSKAGREPQQIQKGDIVTDDVVNSINQEIADAPKFSIKTYHGSQASFDKFSIRLKSAIEDTETNPSDAQKESGNYKKGHIKFGGYDYTIENPKGSTRSGKDADGKEWKVTMHDTYGYIRGKFGKDGDHLDMFINDKADLDNWNGDVFVVDQVNPDGSFDEHKVMYGYDSMDDAKKAYLANYSDGWQGLGNITGASKDEFDKWLDTSNRKLKPFADYAKVKFSLKDIKPVGIGAFGNIYNQFRGNAKAAIEFLKKVRGGEAVGALHHKDIGDIDLVWGKEGTGHSDGYGLSKLVKYHPEVLDNLQEILNDMRVVSSSKNRVNLESETHKAGVRLTWDGERKSWLLTAFKKETSASDKRTDTAATSLEGDTALSQTEGSAAKIDNSSETAKENGEKFSLKDEKIKSVAEKFGVNEDDVAMYANAVERGSTAEAARARANIKRYLLQANEDKISSFKDIIKYTKPINEALKENFGDLDAMIEERRKQVEAQRNAMEAARKRAQEEEEKRQKHLDELSLIPTDELDKRYMDAIANNDESTAREMLDESARRNGYGDVDSDYQGQGAWAAPSNPQYESDEARRADIENSPDVNLEDIALGYNLQPDDYFDNPRAYMNNTAYGLESAHVIKNALDAIKNGEKDVKVKVYRAVPTSVKEGKLRNGDWVTPSKKYAEMHGDNRLDGKYRIIEDEVPANQLWWDGNDVNEFGFDDGKEYRYKNAKNNRKLNDLITYDNKGNVIPPSKRFNSRKSDIRFSLKEEKEKIVADAKANGTYMTAPNGEKTKLDAEQWATVRTANFKNWFGDWENDPENASKVVDENGEPMVVWHGRSAEFNTFEKKEGVRFIMGLEDKVKAEGFFFSPDKGLAEEFASNSYRHRGGKANVVPCFLNIRRPMDLTGEDFDRIYEDVTGWEYMVGMDTQDNLWGIMDEEGMADKIKEKGYDGAIFVEEVDDSYEPTKISYCALDANQIKSAENNNGDFSADNNDIRFSLAGERGAAAADKAEERTFRMDNLSVARKMEEEKKDAKAIKMATGWERGADGKWRYEMPDAKIKDTMDVGGGHIVKRYEDDMLWNGGKLSNVIDAPELFKAYPHLKDVRIETDAIMNDMPSNGEYNAKTNTITIHADELKYMNSILNHEIQHAIQSIEGFDRGGSPRLVRGEIKKRLAEVTKQIRQLRAEGKEDEAKAIVEKNRGLYNAYQANDDYNSYKSLAGEVEARNVQERMNMTPEERRKTLAESTEDVARKDQIFLGVGDVSFSLRDMADGKESGAADMAEDLKSLNTPGEVDDAINTAIDDMPSGWQMANKKMIHIAQALGENRKAEIAGVEPKFSLKDGTLIKAGTYFSGGGLVEEGLKGIIDPVVAVEYDEKISGVYRNNFGQHIVTADVRDVDPKELVKQIDGEVEYFHASPVCKNYSQAKSNHAEVELDKETAASTAEFINAVKPKVVTIENVKGYKDSEAMKTITDALDANGYTWDADVYNAADYGGYTNRERLIVRAVRDGKLPAKPEKMAHKSGWYEAVADIIPTLTEKKNGVANWMDIRLKADGIDWRNIDKPLYVMGSAYADGKIPHAFADELLPTLRTKSGDVIVMPDGKVYRVMGRVLARVSGVSDDYKMPFSENLSHTIIGNGIPTQLTEHVIAPLLTGSDPKFSIRTYHGTGASFDKFDLSHALEGEGSESFGHGVYVTNSSKIGREYAQRAKNRKMEDLYKNMRYPDGVKGDIFKRRVFGEMVNDVATGGSVASAKEFAKKRVGADANDIQRTLENLKDREKGTEYEQNLKDRLAEYKEGLKWIDSLDEDYLTQGNVNRYDVDIPDDNGSNYLDWEGTIPDSLDKQKVAEDAYKVVSDNQGFNDFKATPLNDFIAHTLKTYVNTTDVAGRVEKLKSDIKNVIENYVADDDVLALNEYLKDATPDDVLATIWYNDLVRDIKDADLGEELYRKLSTYVGDNAASQILSDNGLVGIKYPAGMIHGGAKEGDYNYVIFDENNANIVGNTRFSLRYDQFEHDLNQWKKDNNLPKDAQRPTIPQRNAGESAVDFLRRVDEYRKQMALWKTAPTYEQHLLSDDTALGEFNRELQRGSVLKRIAFQDSMLAIRKAQEAIMKEVGVDRLNMAEDAYTAENRSHGKGKNEFEEYNNEFLQPLRKAYHQMKKVLGDSYDNVRVYMMAKHGLERDAQMAFKKSLEADYEDVNQRSAAYKAYKNDLDRVSNDADLEFGRVDFTTWRQKDNALRGKYSPSYMDYRYDDNGIAYDYSGLSSLFDGSDFEEAAHRLVRDVETKHLAEVQALWNATNAATKKILRDGFKAGMMSKDAYEYVKGMYSHYIPLRGWDGTTADQVWDYIGGGKGAFNQTLKTAHGRTSIADDPIAYIENMAESGILLNNKNWVKQHLMLLAQNHPTSLLTLSKAWYVKSTDANGNEEWIPATPQITSQMNSNQVKAAIDAFEQKMEQMAQTGDATQKRDGLNITYPQTHSEEREHEVRVMKDGEEYVIYVNGDPQLAQAMNNTRAHRVREIQSGKLDRAAAWLGRKMAAAYTSLSPLFIPSNYFRDLTMTLASTAIREDGRYNYLLRKNLATSWNLGFMLRDYQNGKLREKVNNGNATAKEQMFYDFMMNGGETGFVSSLDVEDLKKKFKNDLKDLDRWKANPVKVGHTIMDGIEFLNRMIEDSNRFAVYMTSIQYGRSIDEAVNDAKDVTLNFNRKGTGEYGWQMIRNLYLFINPAVQSLQTLGALTKHHPFKFTAVTAAWLASGVLVPIVNAALMSLLGGDDDKDKYWQFTKWDRRNNLIMWIPFTNEYVKIPLAQEFRAFYGVGDMIASKMMGGELAEETWSQYAEDLLGQVVDMLPLDPTGYDGNIAVSLMPNPIRPVFELAFNVDFTGKPLFKETEYNKYDPNFNKAYVGTPDWLVRVSKMVNSIGNDYPDVQQNAIDAFGDPRYNLNNPAVVDHVLSSYLGGAYTMGSQVLGVLTKSLNDPKEIKMADIPLVSKFVSNPDDRPVTKKQGDEFWNMKENHDRAANTLSKLKKQAKVDGDYSILERFYGSEEYKQYKQEDVKVKKYEEDKKKERAEESGEEYRPHKLNAEDIYKAHTTPKDDFEDLKLKQLYTKLNGFKTSYDLLVDTAPSQSDGYYNTNKVAIDAIDEISLDKQEISELKKGFLEDGKDAYNAEDMKRIRELRKRILSVLETANKVVVANQKAKAEKK